MIKQQIKKFSVALGPEKFECTVPFSVKTVLSSAGLSPEALGREAVIEGRISVDDAALSMRYFYIRIKGINMPAKIYIDGRLILQADGVTPVYNIDVKEVMHRGDNIISISFDSADGDILHAGLPYAIEVMRFSHAVIEGVNLTQTHSDEGVNLGISLKLIGDVGSVRAVASLVSSAGQIYYAGLTKGEGSISIKDPLFWWPKGHGVQNICRLTVNLYGESDIEDSAELRLGLRTVDKGAGGNIIINGRKIIPMGAVYIPDGDFENPSAVSRVEFYVSAASSAGCNCLVIPLGAPTPCERFYEMCDEKGIMVIEEHSSLEPSKIEALRQRSNHPSLCLVDLIGGGDRSVELQNLIDSIPEMKVRVLESVPVYVGLPSLPSMKTIRAAIPEGERNLFSHSVEALAEPNAIHQMLMLVADRYPYPKDLNYFAYASALASAHQIGDVIKESRLTLGASGRAVFHRLNDNTMAISDSAIDSRDRPKPLQYYAARHFAPVAVYADYFDGVITFRASNQRKLDVMGTLEIRIADSSNYTVYRESVPCEIEGMTSAKLHMSPVSKYIEGHERDYYLECSIKEGSSVLSQKIFLFVPEKHFKFKKPNIRASVTGQDSRFSITLSADVFVKDLELSFDGVDAVFEDNYFDISQEAPIKVGFTVKGGETAEHLTTLLEMKSVVDLKG